MPELFFYEYRILCELVVHRSMFKWVFCFGYIVGGDNLQSLKAKHLKSHDMVIESLQYREVHKDITWHNIGNFE